MRITLFLLFLIILSFVHSQDIHVDIHGNQEALREAPTTASDSHEKEPSVTGRATEPSTAPSTTAAASKVTHEEEVTSVSPTAVSPPRDVPLPGASGRLDSSHPRFLNPRVSLPMSTSASLLWRIISDLDQNRNFHVGIVSQTMLNSPLRGVGATRHTKTVDGSDVIDRVIDWNPNKGHTIELVIQPEDYPFEIGSKEIFQIDIREGTPHLSIEMQVIVKRGIDLEAAREVMLSQFRELGLAIEKYAKDVENSICKGE